jgi:GNAT superfamily N-acetyltransferase
MIGSQISTAHLRTLRAGDLAAAAKLSSAAGWNQTAEDWSMMMDLAPDGCFGIEVDGQLVSTTTLLCYGRQLAWVGMVLTRSEYRGRGFASKLLAHVLQYANSIEIQTIKLDATDQGRHLYETFGFQPEQAVERWSRAGVSKSAVHRDSAHELSLELDRSAFGADRCGLLEKLAARSEAHANSGAFLLSRSGRNAKYLGPCIASHPDSARMLITECIGHSPDAGWSWDLFRENREAIAIAGEFGFSRQRCLTRMWRGKPLRGRDELVYAIAGFELG